MIQELLTKLGELNDKIGQVLQGINVTWSYLNWQAFEEFIDVALPAAIVVCLILLTTGSTKAGRVAWLAVVIYATAKVVLATI